MLHQMNLLLWNYLSNWRDVCGASTIEELVTSKNPNNFLTVLKVESPPILALLAILNGNKQEWDVSDVTMGILLSVY